MTRLPQHVHGSEVTTISSRALTGMRGRLQPLEGLLDVIVGHIRSESYTGVTEMSEGARCQFEYSALCTEGQLLKEDAEDVGAALKEDVLEGFESLDGNQLVEESEACDLLCRVRGVDEVKQAVGQVVDHSGAVVH